MARLTVSDQGFDFSTPPRREAKRFEPPPWELAAFEELERKKAEEAAVASHTDVVEQDLEPRTQAPAQPEPAAPAVEGESQAVLADDEKLDETMVLEMMARLSAEEPKLHDTTWKIELAAGVLAGVVGLVMTVWGVAALVKTKGSGTTGALGSLTLMAFGIGFVAMAGWTIVRTLRQRGVL